MSRRRRIVSTILAAGGVPFAPTSITGLQIWLDFSDLTTLFQDSAGSSAVTADGQTVGRVADKSGNARHHTQAGGDTVEPTYKVSIKNSLSVARFDGGDYMTVTYTLAQPYTIYSVANPTNSGATRALYGVYGASPAVLRIRSATNIELFAGTSLSLNVGTSTGWAVLAAQFNGASSQLWVNGESKGTGNAGANSLANPGFNPIFDTFTGDVGELLVYSGTHSDAQRLSVETYLNAKWAAF